MAMIFQEPMTSLNPAYTVGSQMTEVLRRHSRREPARRHRPRRRPAGPRRHHRARACGSASSRTSSRAACASGS